MAEQPAMASDHLAFSRRFLSMGGGHGGQDCHDGQFTIISSTIENALFLVFIVNSLH